MRPPVNFSPGYRSKGEGPTASVPEIRHEPDRLLERDSELGALREHVRTALAEHGSTVVIEGPAGVGKTRLIGGARRIASEQGLSCLVARGGRLEREFGFGIVRQLYEQHVTSLPEAERARALEGAAALAMPLLGLEGAEGDPSPASAPDPEFAVLHGLYWLSANLAATSPLAIAVDDAQWADRPSLRFLAYLAHRIADLPILLVLGVRTGEPDSPDELLGTLSAGGSPLELKPLSEAATGELVRSSLGRSGDAEFVAACHWATGGNPFLLTALLGGLRARGMEPTAASAELVREASVDEIARALTARMGALPAAATGLAEAVAILGNDIDLSLAARLAELGDDDAATAADALAIAEILAPTRPLEFVHPLVRAAVYDGIPPARRAKAHGRAAAMLNAAGAEPERVALHLLEVEPGAVQDAAASLAEAAACAAERGSPENAAVYLGRALAEPVEGEGRSELLHRLGGTELRRGDPAAVEHLREALELTERPPLRANIARELCLALAPGGDLEGAISVLEHAAAELGADDLEVALLVEAEIGSTAMLSAATVGAAIDRLVGRRDEVFAADTPGQRAVLGTIALLEASGEAPADRAAESAARALDRGLVADQGAEAMAFANAVFALGAADRFDDAILACEGAIADARRRGSLFGVAAGNAFRATLSLRCGALAEGEVDARAAVEAAGPAAPALSALATGWLIEILVERGRLDEAVGELDRAQLEGEPPDVLMLTFPLVGRARLKLALGDATGALEDLRLLDHREAGGRARNPAWFGHRALIAEALVQLGEREHAAEMAAEELELARRWGAPRAVGIALRAVGLTGTGEGRVEALIESVAVLEASAARLEHARSLVELGAELRRRGRRRECREPLAQGMDIAHRCGASPLSERAREELLAAGARPRRMVRSGVEALTPSELRVARMAADGMTNREIAQALFVTLRTVEVHLTHTYQKLDISSREELPDALGSE